MPELLATLLLLIKGLKRRPVRHKHKWRVDGIGIDGSVFEVCELCTRVRVYLVDRNGEPLGICEIDRINEEESAENAIMRVYRNQSADVIDVDK